MFNNSEKCPQIQRCSSSCINIIDPEMSLLAMESDIMTKYFTNITESNWEAKFKNQVYSLMKYKMKEFCQFGIEEEEMVYRYMFHLEKQWDMRLDLLQQIPHRLSRFNELDNYLNNAPLDINCRDLVQEALNDLCRFGQNDSHLCQLLASTTIDHTENLTLVPNMMNRVKLLKFNNFEVRLHLFEDAAETHIHNHGQNFFSLCLQEGYTHSIWGVVPDGGTHYKTMRKPGGELSKPSLESGSLDVLLSHEFTPGQLLFVDASVFHTVSPLKSNEVQSENKKVITLTLRSLTRINTEATILSHSSDIQGPTENVEMLPAKDIHATVWETMRALESGIDHDICTNESIDEQLGHDIMVNEIETKLALKEVYKLVNAEEEDR